MATTSFPRILPGAKTHFPLSSGGHELWHKSVPTAVSRALEWEDDSAGWKAWREHLRSRLRPRVPGKLFGDDAAFLWGSADRGPASSAGLSRRIDKLLRMKQTQAELGEELRYWLLDATAARQGIARATDSLCWCWNLPRLARRLSATLWWTLLNRLVETCHHAAQQDLGENPAAQQILAGELPLTLAYLLPELKACRKLVVPARQALITGLEGLVDPTGFLDGRHWSQLGLLLGSWTRSRLLGAELRQASWNADTHQRYSGLVVQALRGATPEGAVVLGPASAVAWPPEFWSAALRVADKASARSLAAAVLPQRVLADLRPPVDKTTALPEPAAESDTAGVAILRGSARRRGDLLAVECDGSQVRLELISARDRLLSGTWDLDLRVADEALLPVSPWESVCWVTDEDVVYHELERSFVGGVRIQRQMLLAREDRFLLLADTVLGRPSAPISYRGSLPLGGIRATEPAQETRELRLRGEQTSALVLPLGLGEWRQGSALGTLEVRDRTLVLEQQAAGGGLFAALFIDLDRRRESSPCTWRPLTVAADRTIQPAAVAVGYRVQIAERQWLVYRAMAERAARTVLGANTWSPFLTARIKKSGQFETLLEIE